MDIAQQRSEELTIERFNRTQDRVARDMGHGDTVGGRGVAKANLRKLSEAIALKITEALQSGESRELCQVIKNLDPDVVALSALSSALDTIGMGVSLQRAITKMGSALAGECYAHGLLTENRKLAKRIERAVSERHGNLTYRKQAARSIVKRAGFKTKYWSHEEIVRAGEWLLDVILTALPDVFELARDEDGKPVLDVTPGALEVAQAAVEQAIRRNPVFVPTLEKPAPWTGWRAGGYWDERARLNTEVVRTIYKETSAAVRGAIRSGTMMPHIKALNALQSVGWKINKPILEVVKGCYDLGIPVKGLPAAEDVPIPRKPDAWERMSDSAKEVWKQEASKVKEYNRSLVGDRLVFAQDCETADLLSEHERFYTPLNCDWRGRVYGVCHFNFQRDDRVRALFLFADGEPLGEDGLRWLKIHVANCGDFDKVSKRTLDERVAWTDANLERIIDCTNHPLHASAVSFWTEADKPFLFLAACLELAEAVKSPNPTNFTTRLPVSFDGSCSGLQHLCAMTRAPEGSLVNLTPLPKPQDVYQTVADKVTLAVLKDVQQGNQLAKLVQTFGVTRKVVKRNVMTYSYLHTTVCVSLTILAVLSVAFDADALAVICLALVFATNL